MICPKCSCKFFKRMDDHHCCMTCGKLIYSAPETVLEYDPKAMEAPYFPGSKTLSYDICHRYRDSIHMQREAGTSWDTITLLLRKVTGARLNPTTIKKYALKILGSDPCSQTSNQMRSATLKRRRQGIASTWLGSEPSPV